MYHGPRDGALDFFMTLGFACPERTDPADFLQEVTSRKDQAVRRVPSMALSKGSGVKIK